MTRFFDGLDLLPPGVVPVPKWRPDSEFESSAKSTMWGGVARQRLDQAGCEAGGERG